MSSPTQRSIKRLKDEGFECGIVEKFNRFAGPHGIRQDLFGFIDIVAVSPIHGIVGIQTTSRGGFNARVAKIKSEPRHIAWLNSGGRIFVHGWRKGGARGKAKRWMCHEREINLQGVCPRMPSRQQ